MSQDPAPTASSNQAARPSIIQLAIKEKGALYAAYIPIFKNGGIFIPTTKRHQLGDDVMMLISLPDDMQRYPIAGKVAWLTPARASANRTQGIGVRFPADEKAQELKGKIENMLGAHLGSDRPNQTI